MGRSAAKQKDEIVYDHNNDGIDRRGFLKCMAWAGTGAFCVIQGGVLKSYSLSHMAEANAKEAVGELSFVQISDSHMGFNKPANPDVAGTLKAAVDKINGLATPPEFMLHTGDISHLSKPEEFDTVDQILKSAKPKDVFCVPGEHDVLNDNGQEFLEGHGKGAKSAGSYSFDKKGVHFIGLVNVMNLKGGGLGTLGHDQLEWLEDDVKHLNPVRRSCYSPTFPCGRFTHGRQRTGAGLFEEARLRDGVERAHPPNVAEGRREGDISHSGVDGVSTASAGKADSPGPMKVPADQLKNVLGITDVNYVLRAWAKRERNEYSKCRAA